MTEPMTNNWKINGRSILEPTAGFWKPRRVLDVDGNNRAIYPPVREFEMRWQLESQEDWGAVQVLFDAVESTGTSVVQIPEFPTATGSPYAFREYSGVMISEPEVGPYFETYPTQVVLLLRNIQTR